jgi:hypothetical protein
MRILLLLVGLALLWLACWPLAIAVAILFVFFQLVALPFRIVGVVLAVGFALIRGLFLLPARMLGRRPRRF